MDRQAPTIAVIGAGWAGLSCERLLQDSGFGVHVFEASRQIGGRARGLSLRLGDHEHKLDNGQHLVVGAYRCFRALLDYCGRPSHELFVPPEFNIRQIGPKAESQRKAQSRGRSAENDERPTMTLGQRASIRRVQHWIAGGGKPASAWRQALALGLSQLAWLQGARRIPPRSLLELAAMMRLARTGSHRPGSSVEEWLGSIDPKERLVRQWVAALCESALNCPVEKACASRFKTVINEAMASPQADASAWMQQECDLGELFVTPLMQGLAMQAEGNALGRLNGSRRALNVRLGARVIGMLSDASQDGSDHDRTHWRLQLSRDPALQGPYAQVILALDPQSARRLAQASAACGSRKNASLWTLTDTIRPLPQPLGILTRWLLLPETDKDGLRISQRQPELLLSDQGPAAWLFPRYSDHRHSPTRVAGLVISAQTDSHEARKQADAIQARFAIDSIDHQDIYEHQAATPSVAGSDWPGFDQLGDAGLWLAGDWVGNSDGAMLPASLESTLRSACACARAIARLYGRELPLSFQDWSLSRPG